MYCRLEKVPEHDPFSKIPVKLLYCVGCAITIGVSISEVSVGVGDSE